MCARWVGVPTAEARCLRRRTPKREALLPQPHAAPLSARLKEGAILAVLATVVRMALDPHALIGLPTSEVAGLLAGIAVLGTAAGAGYYATDGLRSAGGWRRAAAHVVTVVGFAAIVVVIVRVLY